MKKLFLFGAIALLLATVGCGDDEEKVEKEKYEIYENHDIIACGIDDPLNNLKWLADMNKDKISEITLLKNKKTGDNSIQIAYSYSLEESYAEHPIFVKTCENKQIFHWATGSPSPEYIKFFEENETVGIIYKRKKL